MRTFLLLPPAVPLCFLIMNCDDASLNPNETDEDNIDSEVFDQVNACSNDAQCQPFMQCVQGGYVACIQSHCSGVNNDVVNFDCVKATQQATTPNNTATCGTVNAPPEQVLHDHNSIVCDYKHPRDPGDDESRAWLQCTADVSGSSVTVHELTTYCIRQNGTIYAVDGTAVGKKAISWATIEDRNTWYADHVPGEGIDMPSNQTYAVPTYPYLLHIGHGTGTKLPSDCREVVVKAVMSMTGDAKCQAGCDSYLGNSVDANGNYDAMGVSGWTSCTSGGTVTLLTARQGDNCAYSLGNTCNAQTETCNGMDDDCDGQIDEGNVCDTTPPSSNGCPASGVQITPSQALITSCGNVQIVTWNGNKDQLTSNPGQPLTFADTWDPFAYIDTICNGVYHDPWPNNITFAQAGFSKACYNGQDVTQQAKVCWDSYSNKYRPAMPMMSSAIGQCP